jgi:hypothetical protein
VLALSTAVLLAVWLRLVLVGQRLSLAMTIAGFWWPWFFPLWFFLTRPAICAKNPYWRWMSGVGFASGEVRTASLVNRERTSPVTHAMWAVPVLRFVLLLAAVAARGLMPSGPGSLGDAIDPEVARATIAEDEADRTSKRMTPAGGARRRPQGGGSPRLADPSSGPPKPRSGFGGRAGEPSEASSGNESGAMGTSGPTRRRRWRARGVLGGAGDLGT